MPRKMTDNQREKYTRLWHKADKIFGALNEAESEFFMDMLDRYKLEAVGIGWREKRDKIQQLRPDLSDEEIDRRFCKPSMLEDNPT